MTTLRRALLGAMAIGAVAVAGCGSDDDSSTATSASTPAASTSASTPATTTGGQGKAPNIANIDIVYSDFQQAQEEGMKSVVDKYGGSIKTFNANYDPQKQLQQCKDAVSSGRFNAILLQVLDPASGVPCVAAAKAAGIPVVAVDGAIGTDSNDLEPQVDGVVGGVYATPKANTEANIGLVKDACAGADPCKVIVELATPTDPMTNDVADAIAKDVPGAEVVAKFVSGFDPGVIAQKMPDLLNANKDVNVFVSIADSSALAAVPAIKAAGLQDQIKILGDGGSRAGAKAIADGTMFASTGNWPRQEGEIVAEMAYKAINGQPIDPKGIEQNDVDKPLVLTKETIAQFTPEWGAES